MVKARTSRADAQTVYCPRCWAKAGEQCRGTRGPRKASHRQRHALVRARRV